jgi:uncharacterized protein HemY
VLRGLLSLALESWRQQHGCMAAAVDGVLMVVVVVVVLLLLSRLRGLPGTAAQWHRLQQRAHTANLSF